MSGTFNSMQSRLQQGLWGLEGCSSSTPIPTQLPPGYEKATQPIPLLHEDLTGALVVLHRNAPTREIPGNDEGIRRADCEATCMGGFLISSGERSHSFRRRMLPVFTMGAMID